MAVTNQIQIDGQTNDIGAKAENVSYSNEGLSGVSNVKDALDFVIENGSGGGGGGSVAASAAPYFKNPPIPTWKDNLKVLFIGNSYTLYSIGEADPTMPTILNELQISENEITLYYAHSQASSLAAWLDAFKNKSVRGAIERLEYKNNAWKITLGEFDTGNIYNTIVGTPWDIIVFQVYPQTAASGERANNYDSFKETIRSFIYEIRKVCPNRNVAFGFHMIWAKNTSRVANVATWSAIVSATEAMVSDAGVDIIVPSGTAMMNAVNTNTFKGESHDFLVRDSTGHPAWGVARYILSCTIWETLFAPVLNKSMYGLTSLPPYTRATTNVADIEVTAENIELCQKIAMAAVCDRFHANTTIDPIQAT